MPIETINEITNPNNAVIKPVKEVMDIYIPDVVNENISRRNGMVYAICGSGGSGKTNLMLNLFRDKKCYRGKFHNLYYFCPLSSFLSIANHPFAAHDKVFHDLTVETLDKVYNELIAIKERKMKNLEKKKKKEQMKKKMKKGEKPVNEFGDETDDDSDEDTEPEYSCIIIDDHANQLKDKYIQIQLNKMLIKARHIACGFIFTLQSYYYLPKILRKQLNYATIFKPKNTEEWYSISKELLSLGKEDALKLYNYIYDAPYTHLDLDTNDNKIYKNFNKLELIEKNENNDVKK